MTAWMGVKKIRMTVCEDSDLPSMGKLGALSREWIYEMQPEGMVCSGMLKQRGIYPSCWEKLRLEEKERGGQ